MLSLLLLLVASISAEELVKLGHDKYLDAKSEKGWKKLNRVEPDKKLHLTFAIKQQHIDNLADLAKEISNPKSPFYGRYMTMEQINEFAAPASEAVNKVKKWLRSHNVTDCTLTLSKDFMNCAMSCSTAEKLLPGAVFHYYMNPKVSESVIRSTSSYYVPVSVSKYLDFVWGIHRFPAVK